MLNRVVNDDFRHAEYTSLPLTLAILTIAFGALVAALLPVVLAFTAVLGAIGLTIQEPRLRAARFPATA